MFGQIFFNVLPQILMCFKYDAFCSNIFDLRMFKAQSLLLLKRFKFMENWYSSKTLLKETGKHPPHSPGSASVH